MQNTWTSTYANTTNLNNSIKISDLTPEFTTLLNTLNSYTYSGYSFDKLQELTTCIDNLWNQHLGRIETYITEKELDLSLSTSQRNILEILRTEYDQFIDLLQNTLTLPDYVANVLSELSNVKEHLQTEAQKICILQIDTQVKLRIRLLRDKLNKLIVLCTEFKKK